MWEWIWAISVAVLGGACFRAWLKRGQQTHIPTNWPLLGMLPALLHNLHHMYEWSATILINNGGTFILEGPWLSSMRYFVTADPLNVEHALRTHFHNFPKGKEFSEIGHDLVGDSIFNADGHLWQKQRKISSLQLNSRMYKQFSDDSIFSLVENKLLPTMQHFCNNRSQVDFQDLMLRFTFDTICLVNFGVDTGCLSPDLPVVPFAEAVETALECTVHRFFLPPTWWKTLRWLRLGKERCMPHALTIVHEFCEKVMSFKRSQLKHEEGCCDKNQTDLLSCFLRMGGDISDNEKLLKDLAIGFLIAGRDTSAQALSWFFWLLAKHPDVEERVAQEVRHVIGSFKKESALLTRMELNRMPYLHAALTEALRLYPSIPIDIKHVVEDDVFPDGSIARKDNKFVYSIYAMGRMESIWGRDCTSFRPERWLNPCDGTFTDSCVSPFQYLAFHAGPRTCLGKDMAYCLMKTVASTLLYHFRVILVPGHKVVPKLSISLYMQKGLLVTLEPRTYHPEVSYNEALINKSA